MNKRVVFSGMGVLACNGKGKDEFWAALEQGQPGFKPISLFDASEFSVNMAGEVADFEPKKYFGPKGLRSLDRSTKMLVSASKLAIADSGFTITDQNTDDRLSADEKEHDTQKDTGDNNQTKILTRFHLQICLRQFLRSTF